MDAALTVNAAGSSAVAATTNSTSAVATNGDNNEYRSLNCDENEDAAHNTGLLDGHSSFVQKLIPLVRYNRGIYDPKHAKYSIATFRLNLWKNIAHNLNSDVDTCACTWIGLRFAYQQYLRDLNEHMFRLEIQNRPKHTAGAADVAPPPLFPYAAEMSFMSGIIYSQKMVANTSRWSTNANAENNQLASNTEQSIAKPKKRTDPLRSTENNMYVSFVGELFPVTEPMTKFVECVRAYPELYDTNHPQYGNFARRNWIWAAIGDEVKDKALRTVKKWYTHLTMLEYEIHHELSPPTKSAHRELMSFAENLLKHNPHTIFKQSYFLKLGWCEPIEEFKVIRDLLSALKRMPDLVEMTEQSLYLTEKPATYCERWRAVSQMLRCRSPQAEVTWLLLRQYHAELLLLRRNGHLPDRWVFDVNVCVLLKNFKHIESSLIGSTTMSVKEQPPTVEKNREIRPTPVDDDDVMIIDNDTVSTPQANGDVVVSATPQDIAGDANPIKPAEPEAIVDLCLDDDGDEQAAITAKNDQQISVRKNRQTKNDAISKTNIQSQARPKIIVPRILSVTSLAPDSQHIAGTFSNANGDDSVLTHTDNSRISGPTNGVQQPRPPQLPQPQPMRLPQNFDDLPTTSQAAARLGLKRKYLSPPRTEWIPSKQQCRKLSPLELTPYRGILIHMNVQVAFKLRPDGYCVTTYASDLGRYRFPLVVVLNIVREVLAVPQLHSRKFLHEHPTYWKGISRKIEVDDRLCEAVWNFIARKLQFWDQIFQRAHILRPVRTTTNSMWTYKPELFLEFERYRQSCYWWPYQDMFSAYIALVRRSESIPDILATLEAKTDAWGHIIQYFPDAPVALLHDAWHTYKYLFTKFLKGLEEGIIYEWSRESWKTLVQMEFLIEEHYPKTNVMNYVAHIQFRIQVKRCKLLDKKADAEQQRLLSQPHMLQLSPQNVRPPPFLQSVNVSNHKPIENPRLTDQSNIESSAPVLRDLKDDEHVRNAPKQSLSRPMAEPQDDKHHDASKIEYREIDMERLIALIYSKVGKIFGNESDEIIRYEAWSSIAKDLNASVHDCVSALFTQCKRYQEWLRDDTLSSAPQTEREHLEATLDAVNLDDLPSIDSDEIADLERSFDADEIENGACLSPLVFNAANEEYIPVTMIVPEPDTDDESDSDMEFTPQINLDTTRLTRLLIKNWGSYIDRLSEHNPGISAEIKSLLAAARLNGKMKNSNNIANGKKCNDPLEDEVIVID